MPDANSDHSRRVLIIAANATTTSQFEKMIKAKEKSLELAKEQVGFCEIAIDIFKAELQLRRKK